MLIARSFWQYLWFCGEGFLSGWSFRLSMRMISRCGSRQNKRVHISGGKHGSITPQFHRVRNHYGTFFISFMLLPMMIIMSFIKANHHIIKQTTMITSSLISKRKAKVHRRQHSLKISSALQLLHSNLYHR